MGNLELYNAFAGVPENAKRPISAGKLKGKTDINPMWRIKTLTAAFGPCGFGWTTKITEHWIERDGAFSGKNLHVMSPIFVCRIAIVSPFSGISS